MKKETCWIITRALVDCKTIKVLFLIHCLNLTARDWIANLLLQDVQCVIGKGDLKYHVRQGERSRE